MLKTLKNFLIRNYPVVALSAFWAVLLFANYTNGTHLIGWDSLQTELDPGLAVKRAFFASWQEYQSLGLPAGMGHAADLLRSIILWAASFVLPASLIRYGFHMGMVLVGCMGMLKLLEVSGFKSDNKILPAGRQGFAFLGALFYILNFNIIQMMFLPYESFSIFTGLLPWEIWAFLRFMNKDNLKRKDWIIFILIFVIAISQAQALQLFVVLMLSLFLITVGLSFGHKKLPIFKRAFIGAVVIFLINSFWLLPQAYFLKTSAAVVQTAKINQLSTQDVLYRNKDKGNLKDFLSYTGFFSEGVDRNQAPLFAGWKDHREKIPVMVLLYVLSGISLLGIFARSKYRLPFFLLYILVAIALLNNTFPLDSLNDLIRKNSLINQIFRSPFTKFSILYALVAAYFFAAGANLIAENLAKILPNKKMLPIAKNALFALLTAAIVIQALPSFQGLYISPEVKVKIPKSYFEAFSYFKTVDKNKRIALLPEYTHWGWFFNEWGYDGSGFIWYGIEQPIISRNFDMWSTKSEGYYWEMKNALEQEDVVQVERVLDKYNVSYLIFDHSVSPVVASVKTIQDTRVEELLRTSNKIKFEKKWDLLTLYKVTPEKKVDDFVWISESLPNIGPKIDVTNYDSAYSQYGNYQTSPNKPYDMYYPFLDLTTQTKPENRNWEMKELEKDWEFTSKLPVDVTLPDKQGKARYILYNRGKIEDITLPYTISVRNNEVKMRFPKTLLDFFQTKHGSLRYCVNRKESITPVKDDKALRIEANGGNYVCSDYGNSNLDQKHGYILKIKNKNIEGQRLFFYALDTTKDQPYIEDRLSQDTQYYILGDKYKQGAGYSFTFQANSYKTIPSVNYLESLSVYLIPYDVIKEMGIKMSRDVKRASTVSDFEAEKIAYHKYAVTLNPSANSNQTVVLNQAYHEGWHAYEIAGSKWQIANSMKQLFPFIFGKEVKNHTIVSNWANGWVLDNRTPSAIRNKLVIVYLPQYLQYVGLIILGMTLIYFLIPKRIGKNKRKNDI